MLDLVTILSNPNPIKDRDFYIPTAEETAGAKEAYEALRREEDPQADHQDADEFSGYLMKVAGDLVAEGVFSEEDLAELEEDLADLLD